MLTYKRDRMDTAEAMIERPYSTNNGWGFGGSFGTEYLFEDGWVLRIGKACFRHLPPRQIAYAIEPGGRRHLDLHGAEAGTLRNFAPAALVDLLTSRGLVR